MAASRSHKRAQNIILSQITALSTCKIVNINEIPGASAKLFFEIARQIQILNKILIASNLMYASTF